MDFLTEFMQPTVLGICLCVGYILKHWVEDLDNRFIPTACALLGVLLCTWLASWSLSPDTILGGLVSGLASTGLHQLFSQFIEKRPEG